MTARIQTASPRLRDRERPITPVPTAIVDERIVLIEMAPAPRRILARLDDLSRAFGEKTFYLLDAEGWR